MRLRVAILIAPMRGGGLAGEQASCAVVDILSAGGAPGDELIRIDIHPHCGMPLAGEMALHLFRSAQPLVIGDGELISIRHDLEDARVIRAAIPGQGDQAHLGRDAGDHLASILSAAAERAGVAQARALPKQNDGGAA